MPYGWLKRPEISEIMSVHSRSTNHRTEADNDLYFNDDSDEHDWWQAAAIEADQLEHHTASKHNELTMPSWSSPERIKFDVPVTFLSTSRSRHRSIMKSQKRTPSLDAIFMPRRGNDKKVWKGEELVCSLELLPTVYLTLYSGNLPLLPASLTPEQGPIPLQRLTIFPSEKIEYQQTTGQSEGMMKALIPQVTLEGSSIEISPPFSSTPNFIETSIGIAEQWQQQQRKEMRKSSRGSLSSSLLLNLDPMMPDPACSPSMAIPEVYDLHDSSLLEGDMDSKTTSGDTDDEGEEDHDEEVEDPPTDWISL
ncbi:uncharacterized protein BT62DRAFT_919225 [Guyanagaster necrorhizus]|uniref:Uncharacterized protein n=1 Tax=Guyanagaster necrorhizus TaxID=856835 RepID=A0A9P7VVP1_9AGAR|nr:uncharacterized protein BT62DRAFT_919225 [Guyanagaster necrorhizus MCA 3950]KAG7447315.1 hypothetical protein BT62DRAFT_919225 [Guyanagaster necrorhizus MCA 3950]